jgi:hypothetical protein
MCGSLRDFIDNLRSEPTAAVRHRRLSRFSGTFGKDKITGKITYLDAAVGCTSRSYSAKHYGVDPQG